MVAVDAAVGKALQTDCGISGFGQNRGGRFGTATAGGAVKLATFERIEDMADRFVATDGARPVAATLNGELPSAHEADLPRFRPRHMDGDEPLPLLRFRKIGDICLQGALPGQSVK